MKILHSADLHLGKSLNDFSLLELQKEMLEALTEAVTSHDIDILLLAGDIYDRSLPPKEAVELLSSFLTRLCRELDVKVVMIAGNHDSPQRLSYASELLAGMGLYVAGLDRKMGVIDFGDVAIYPLAYMDRAQLNSLHGTGYRSLEEALAHHLSEIKLDPDKFNVLMAHHYILGDRPLIESDSERPLFLGSTENISKELFLDYDYVALGHIHTQQKLGERIYYSGAPMKYSKSEAGRTPGYLVVDTKSGQVDFHPLRLSRDLRVLRGSFSELLEGGSQDLIFFELEDRSYIPDAMNRLKKAYPNALGLSYQAIKSSLSSSRAQGLESLDYFSLFQDFYYEAMGSRLEEGDSELVRSLLERSSRETD